MKYNFDQINNRLGTFCTQWDYIEDRFGEKNLLPFSISDTDFKIPKPISQSITEISKRELFGYTRWNHMEYKRSVTDFFQRRHDCTILPEWIVYSPSVMYSVSLLIRLLTRPNDKIVTFEPMYDSFFSVIEDNERILISHRLQSEKDGFQIDFKELENQLKQADLLLLCSPHNPTGRIWRKSELDTIIDLCRKYEVKIVSDEIHMDIRLKDQKHIPLMTYINQYDQVYTASSCSKTFNVPGLLGSYVIIPNPQVREEFLHHTRKIDFLNSPSIFGMYATMIGYAQCDDYIDQLNSYVRENMEIVQKFLKDNLPDFSFEIPDGTYLAWIDGRNVPFTSDRIQYALVHVGKVAIMKGETYGEAGYKYLRLNCGCPRSKLNEGLRRMKVAMDWLYEQENRHE